MIVIVLDILAAIGVFVMASKYDGLGTLVHNWTSNPFNFDPNSDAFIINQLILFLIAPLIFLIIIPNPKKNIHL